MPVLVAAVLFITALQVAGQNVARALLSLLSPKHCPKLACAGLDIHDDHFMYMCGCS